MYREFSSALEQGRVRHGLYASPPKSDYGAFDIAGPCGVNLHIIASPGTAHEDIPWEHVSVSAQKRCPNWIEMCFVKALFWDDEVTVMQLHPPKSTWINNHPYCLHLWRPINTEIPLPPPVTVGDKEFNL